MEEYMQVVESTESLDNAMSSVATRLSHCQAMPQMDEEANTDQHPLERYIFGSIIPFEEAVLVAMRLVSAAKSSSTTGAGAVDVHTRLKRYSKQIEEAMAQAYTYLHKNWDTWASRALSQSLLACACALDGNGKLEVDGDEQMFCQQTIVRQGCSLVFQ